MDTTTFRDLYAAHSRDVYRFARFLTGDEDVAADITAETFYRAWVGRGRIRAITAKGYLMAIARNLARDERRLNRRRSTSPVPERAVEPDALKRLELNQALDAIRSLPAGYREPLALVVSGLSYEEAGRVLGLPIGTMKIRVYRARLALAARAGLQGRSDERHQ